MGGYGSGCWKRRNVYDTTDARVQVDVRCWQRAGVLTARTSFVWTWSQDGIDVAAISVAPSDDWVTLEYHLRRSDSPAQDATELIFLDWTRLSLGGHRPWFRCPGVCGRPCRRRCAILYLGDDGFRRRICCDLRYASQRENDLPRARRRVEGIRHQLRERLSEKPMRVHWRTCLRLAERLDAAERRYDAIVEARYTKRDK